MKLYRPVLIESAEQAEALPIGTVAILGPHEDGPMSFLRSDGNAPPWYGSTDGDSHTSNGEMVGCIALVPIEAEEEWALIYDGEEPTPCADEADAREWARIDGEGQAPSRRYTTVWEETP